MTLAELGAELGGESVEGSIAARPITNPSVDIPSPVGSPTGLTQHHPAESHRSFFSRVHDFAQHRQPSPEPPLRESTSEGTASPEVEEPRVDEPQSKVLETEEEIRREQEFQSGGRDFLKIRFLTWNMHDSIPKGDLSPLLGRVPVYSPPSSEDVTEGKLPKLPLNNEHPYHLIVVAGQECPTPSGIPMGLAAGLKLGGGGGGLSSAKHASKTSLVPIEPNIPLPTPSPSVKSISTPILEIPKQPSTQPSPSNSSTPASPPSINSNLNSKPSAPSSTSHSQPPNLTLQIPRTSSPSPMSPRQTPSPVSHHHHDFLSIPSSIKRHHGKNESPLSKSPLREIEVDLEEQAANGDGRGKETEVKEVAMIEKARQGEKDKGKGKEKDKEGKDKDKSHPLQMRHETKGWSDLLEDWFANRAGEAAPATLPSDVLSSSIHMQSPDPNSQVQVDDSVHQSKSSGQVPEAGDHMSSGPDQQQDQPNAAERPADMLDHVRIVEEGKGAYQFLVKERLLGIYMSIYVWKGCKQLVKNTSTSYVTTGLIGGRFGNKGGVAISVHFASTRLLFVNSHLAAHASRSDVRLLNVAKIKSELNIDSFLDHGHNKTLMEDPTDRYDCTFWMGDLNFRLDVSRLHADWLISRKDYAQALLFDQLRTIMSEGRGFVGFKEADINFPPTYKYDLANYKPLKKRSTIKRPKASAGVGEDLLEDETENEECAERSSIVSSGWASVGQSVLTDEDLSESSDIELTLSHHTHALAERLKDAQKIFLPSSAIKAKRKIMRFIRSPTPSPSPSLLSRRTSVSTRSASGKSSEPPPADPVSIPPNPPYSSRTSIESSSPPRPMLTRNLSSRLRRSFSVKADNRTLGSDDSEDDDDDEEGSVSGRTGIQSQGIYDTSAKRRVPSWCDRLLWKSFEEDYPTAKEAEDDHHPLSKLEKFATVLHLRKRVEFRRTASLSSNHSNDRRSPTSPSSPRSPTESPMGSAAPSPSTSMVDLAESSGSGTVSPVRPRSSHLQWRTSSFQKINRPLSGTSDHVETQTFTDSTFPRTRPSAFNRTRSHQSVSSLSMHQRDPSVSDLPGPHPTDPSLAETTPPRPRVKSLKSASSPTPSLSPLRPTRFASTGQVPTTKQNHERTSWFTRLFPSHNHPGATDPPTPVDKPERELAFRRKFEVLPLHYGTLNDEEMQQLQGFSDHRPVIGVMAVFV